MAHQYKNMTYSKPNQPAFIRDMLSGNSRASNGGREPIPERPVEDEYADPPSEEEGDEAPLVVQVRKRDLSQAEVQRVRDGEKTPPLEDRSKGIEPQPELPAAEKANPTAGARMTKRKIIVTEGEERDEPAKKAKESTKEKKKKQKKQKGLLSFEE